MQMLATSDAYCDFLVFKTRFITPYVSLVGRISEILYISFLRFSTDGLGANDGAKRLRNGVIVN